MSGVDDTAPGINYCSLSDLFEQCEERRSEAQYSIRVQLLEVYNETVRDLLVSEAEARQQKSLALVATRASGSNVPDATHVEVHSVEEVEEVMARGARNRAVAETRMNERSSRSHQVLTVMVEGTMAATRGRTFGCLHLIDLAGSERVARSGAQGQQLLEAQHINRSLTALGCVMQALAQKREHIPFRDSKLTQLLQDSLAGQAKSMMFMHIAPEETSSSETLSTLNFGKGVTEITLGAAKKNTESGALWELRDKLSAAKQEAAEERRRREALEGEVAALKARLEGARSNSSSEGEGGTDSDSIPAFRGSGLSRPAQVGRLDLSRLSIGTAPQREASPAPVSARLAHQGSSKIPTPVQMGAKLERRGSMTARPAFGQARASPSSADSVSASRRPLTSRGSPSELRSSLAAGSGGGGALQRSRSGLSTGSSAPVPTPRSRLAAAPSQSRRWQ